MSHSHNSEPTAAVNEVIELPIEPVWDLIKSFGTWANWWPVYDFMEMQGPAKIGATRKFKTIQKDGAVCEETITELNHEKYRLSYELTSMSPPKPVIGRVTTTIQLEIISPKQTRVIWTSKTNLQGGVTQEAFKPYFEEQMGQYKKGIDAIVLTITIAAVWKEGLDFFNDKAMSLTKALIVGQTEVWDYESYPEDFGPLPKMIRGLPKSEVLSPRKMGQMMQRFLEVAYLKAEKTISDLLKKGSPQNDGTQPDLIMEASRQLALKYGKPREAELTQHLLEHWTDDVEFCQQLLAGVNPLHIRVLKSEEEIPANMKDLLGQGKTAKELFAEKRLFILDYKELANFKQIPPMYFYAPIMLVYREILADNTSQLRILGISLDRSPIGPVYTPNSEHKNRYMLAKMFVACADNQVHEFWYHLGLSHLTIEPVIVAVHNSFPETHPIRVLLNPHLQDTIGINVLARQVLISKKDSFTDHTFALGTKQGVQVVSDKWVEYDFYRTSFPKQLEERGFDRKRTDGLDSYFYRDDGFLLWDAIGTYTKDVVEHFYKSDADVVADEKIQNWAKEMAYPMKANVKGFPDCIDTREQLEEVLQIIIWNGSALHSALNFPQWPYLGYSPNRPNGLYIPMPAEGGNDITLADVQKALTPKFETLFLTEFAKMFNISFSWLLTLPSDTNLTDIVAMKTMCPEAHENFQANLAKVTGQIKVRNVKLEKEKKAGYVFLMPENVAASVNI